MRLLDMPKKKMFCINFSPYWKKGKKNIFYN